MIDLTVKHNRVSARTNAIVWKCAIEYHYESGSFAGCCVNGFMQSCADFYNFSLNALLRLTAVPTYPRNFLLMVVPNIQISSYAWFALYHPLSIASIMVFPFLSL